MAKMASSDNQSEHDRYNLSGRESEHSKLKAYVQDLYVAGDYYIYTIPSRIDFDRLIETEYLLNSLLIMVLNFDFDEKIIKRIEDRLGKISFMVHEFKSGHTQFNANAFVEIKKSGRELVEIAKLIEKYAD